MKKAIWSFFLISQLIFSGVWTAVLLNIQNPTLISGIEENLDNIRMQDSSWSNVTVISDELHGQIWNYLASYDPAIAVDSSGITHVVWSDDTDAPTVWGYDTELMYTSYDPISGWSYVTAFSGIGVNSWNDGTSLNPACAVDSNDILHVVWADDTNGEWGNDWEVMYATYTPGTGWSNATVISDGYNGNYWNTGGNWAPAIAIDGTGIIHVVWADNTDGQWTYAWYDYEIMHVYYIPGSGWSNATVISDGYNGSYWNTGFSEDPAIAIDASNTVHVVWEDSTIALSTWGWDDEIMYASYTAATGWSNATVISDETNGYYWNSGDSNNPAIAVEDSGRVHVVWHDDTNGQWGADQEIMYASYTTTTGWSSVDIVSDGANKIYWNNGDSRNPAIALSNDRTIHVVWQDATDGLWGIDTEIMYANYVSGSGWSNATVISDGLGGIYWNNDSSVDPAIFVDVGAIHVVWEDNTDGTWGADSEIMYTSCLLPLYAPELLSPIQINGQMFLNWTEVYTAAIYYIYRSDSNITDITGLTPLNTTTHTQYNDTDISEGTYYYAIVAGNPYGNSSISNCEQITVSFPSGIPGFDLLVCLLPFVLLVIVAALLDPKKRHKI